MSERRSPLLLIICILVMAGVCGGLFYLRSNSKEETETPAIVETEEKVEQTEEIVSEEPVEELEKKIEGGIITKETIPSVQFSSSDELVQNFERGLTKIENSKELRDLIEILGAKGITDKQMEDLFSKIGKLGNNLRKGNLSDEVGELERHKRVRWALNQENGGRIFFDVKRVEDGSWKIDKIHDLLSEDAALESILKEGNAGRLDGLVVANSFVQFAIQQKFSKAKQLVDSSEVSDVHLAGLCIIFDDGAYKLREPRGVLNSFDRVKGNKHRAGYSVYIKSETSDIAQFSLLLARDDPKASWKVSEINFSSLLKKFIDETEGDSYFTPFVKNPRGGDSIVVYFEFNDNGLSTRTQRQLKIVANILKLDNKRKIVLTGHTDAVGGDEFNRKLSQKRADSVRDFLVNEGVDLTQVQTIGYGKHRPRKANTRADGSDNPDGRKANRRTEIYLDF